MENTLLSKVGEEQMVSHHENQTKETRRSHKSNDEKHKTHASTLIKMNDFENYVETAITFKLLDEQHKNYVRGQTKPWGVGMLPYHRSKNRYINLIACKYIVNEI